MPSMEISSTNSSSSTSASLLGSAICSTMSCSMRAIVTALQALHMLGACGFNIQSFSLPSSSGKPNTEISHATHMERSGQTSSNAG